MGGSDRSIKLNFTAYKILVYLRFFLRKSSWTHSRSGPPCTCVHINALVAALRHLHNRDALIEDRQICVDKMQQRETDPLRVHGRSPVSGPSRSILGQARREPATAATAVSIWFRVSSSLHLVVDAVRQLPEYSRPFCRDTDILRRDLWRCRSTMEKVARARGDRFVLSLADGGGPGLYTRGFRRTEASFARTRPHLFLSHILSLVIPQHETSIYYRIRLS